MKVPDKGKPVMNDSGVVGYSMGILDGNGCLHISYTNRCDICADTMGKWNEIQITPVVYVPEDMKPVYVWDDVKPTIPHLRISTGKINECGMLDCYIPTDKRQTAPWKYWEEL